jgi:predicted nucleic acid-binding protein
LDATAVVRALLAGPTHPVWSHVEGGSAPELIVTETANALCGYVRSNRLTPSQAGRALAVLLGSAVVLEPLRTLVGDALEFALRHGISANDASYLALAERSGSVLVTADRRLAALATRSELVA